MSLLSELTRLSNLVNQSKGNIKYRFKSIHKTDLVGSSSLDVCSTLPPPPPVCDWVTCTRLERELNFKIMGNSPASTSITWGTNSVSGTLTGTVETECVRRMAMLMGPSPIGSPVKKCHEWSKNVICRAIRYLPPWKGPNILLVSTSPSKDVLMPPEMMGSFDWYSFTWPRKSCADTSAELARIVINS